MIFEDLKARGSAAISEIVENRLSESMGLEFKRKEKPGDFRLSKLDRRMLGKALSAFSNADGGVLLIGIRTENEDGVDVAISTEPIAEVDRFKNAIDALVGEILRPENPDIETLSVGGIGEDGSGCVAIRIGKSDLRPHMSMAPDHQKYFRRSIDFTRPMDHTEVRDMILAPREARLSVSLATGGFSTSSRDPFLILEISMVLFVLNKGRVAAVAPYVRLRSESQIVRLRPVGHFVLRNLRDGSSGIYAPRDIVLHAEDELPAGNLTYRAGVFRDGIRARFYERGPEGLRSNEFWAFGGNVDFDDLRSLEAPFEPVKLQFAAGAQNSLATEHAFLLSKDDLVEFSLRAAEGQLKKILS